MPAPKQAGKTSHQLGNSVLVQGADPGAGWPCVLAPVSQQSWPNSIWASTQSAHCDCRAKMPQKSRISTKDKLLEAKCFSGNYLGSSESLGANRELLISWWAAVSMTKPTLPPVISFQGIPGSCCAGCDRWQPQHREAAGAKPRLHGLTLSSVSAQT